MNIWSKLITALRGGTHEVGEAIVDVQALRILDQEVRDATEELNNARENLAEMMARQKVAEQKSTTLSSKIAEFEGYAIQALDKNDKVLALEVAEKIADLENQLKTEQNAEEGYHENVDSLRVAIKQADSNIKELKHQLEIVKATENVQRAQSAVAQRYSASNSKLTTAMDSLERIKEKQELKSAQLNAAEELAKYTSEDSLKHRLEEAGVVSDGQNADTVLARLKTQLTPRLANDSHTKE